VTDSLEQEIRHLYVKVGKLLGISVESTQVAVEEDLFGYFIDSRTIEEFLESLISKLGLNRVADIYLEVLNPSEFELEDPASMYNVGIQDFIECDSPSFPNRGAILMFLMEVYDALKGGEDEN